MPVRPAHTPWAPTSVSHRGLQHPLLPANSHSFLQDSFLCEGFSDIFWMGYCSYSILLVLLTVMSHRIAIIHLKVSQPQSTWHLSQIILSMFSSSSGLYPLDARSTSPQSWQPKIFPGTAKCSLTGNQCLAHRRHPNMYLNRRGLPKYMLSWGSPPSGSLLWFLSPAHSPQHSPRVQHPPLPLVHCCSFDA